MEGMKIMKNKDLNKKINELVKSFKETDEYIEYINLKEKIKKNSIQYNILKNFKDKQKDYQLEYINGKELTDEKRKEMEHLYSIVIHNEDSRKLLEVEMKINVMLADVQKMIGYMVKEIVD